MKLFYTLAFPILSGKFLEQNFILTNSYNKIIKNLNEDEQLKYYNTTFRYLFRIKKMKRYYQKMSKYKQIPKDLFGFRIIYDTPNITQNEFISYLILNNIERNNKVIKNTYNDYFFNKKSNGYQSLHINVLQSYLIIFYHFEIQIRSEEMDYYINFGPPNEYYQNR